MSDDKKEPWLNLLALTTVIFAVCATLSTFKAGGFSTKSVISQAQASDQWSYFQAKNLRGNLYKLQVEKLQLDSSVLPRATEPEIRERYAKAIRDAESSVRKYESEKAEIQKAAKTLETKRDDAQRHGGPFGIAVIFFQVAILISSVAGLFKRKALWYLSLPIGIVGLLYFANGFFLFF